MDKEDVVYIRNEMLPSHKEERSNATCRKWMGLEIVILSEVRQRKTNMILFICRI